MILILFSTIFFALPFFESANAADSYLVNPSDNQDIDEHGVCQNVSNVGAMARFIPTKTSGEWLSFRTSPPSGISLSACVPADPCLSSPTPGTTCAGGVIYLGSLSPGATSGSGTDHYMTTPGGCTDSSTPTCSGTDSLNKAWYGSSGSNVDIPGLTNFTATGGTGNGAINTDNNYGDYNTTTIVNHASISSDSAADWCNDLVYGGYSDWYLPNRYELNLMFTNKASIPGLDVSGSWYWSSTESNLNYAWIQRFSDGYQYDLGSKSGSTRIRCVRRF